MSLNPPIYNDRVFIPYRKGRELFRSNWGETMLEGYTAVSSTGGVFPEEDFIDTDVQDYCNKAMPTTVQWFTAVQRYKNRFGRLPPTRIAATILDQLVEKNMTAKVENDEGEDQKL